MSFTAFRPDFLRKDGDASGMGAPSTPSHVTESPQDLDEEGALEADGQQVRHSGDDMDEGLIPSGDTENQAVPDVEKSGLAQNRGSGFLGSGDGHAADSPSNSPVMRPAMISPDGMTVQAVLSPPTTAGTSLEDCASLTSDVPVAKTIGQVSTAPVLTRHPAADLPPASGRWVGIDPDDCEAFTSRMPNGQMTQRIIASEDPEAGVMKAWDPVMPQSRGSFLTDGQSADSPGNDPGSGPPRDFLSDVMATEIDAADAESLTSQVTCKSSVSGSGMFPADFGVQATEISPGQVAEAAGTDMDVCKSTAIDLGYATQSRGANLISGGDSPGNMPVPGGPPRHPCSGRWVSPNEMLAAGQQATQNPPSNMNPGDPAREIATYDTNHTVTPSVMATVRTANPDLTMNPMASSYYDHMAQVEVQGLDQARESAPDFFAQLSQPPSGNPAASRSDYVSPQTPGIPYGTTPQQQAGNACSACPPSVKLTRNDDNRHDYRDRARYSGITRAARHPAPASSDLPETRIRPSRASRQGRVPGSAPGHHRYRPRAGHLQADRSGYREGIAHRRHHRRAQGRRRSPGSGRLRMGRKR